MQVVIGMDGRTEASYASSDISGKWPPAIIFSNTLKFSDFRMLLGRIIKQRFLIILKFSKHLSSLREIKYGK
jgi:hypothetical protein